MDPAAIERFRRHAEGCNECRVNAYGLCETGFVLLRGAAACESSEGPQGQLALGEMGERPLVRAYLSHPPSLPQRELRRTGPPSQTGREPWRPGPPLVEKAGQPTHGEYRAPYADA